ncbi:xanthine dehydrogenase small subunit [Marinomonas sp. C2222]|uniref:Xanthine dehydrogenase small subunit n=1 Tax=Marinomonas sargassi TaxID=2984494 RepID=A0ABT2YTE2_9GAMM|nr:xanthine dehydrogenase small subunit [Marinomonas sargassi]MCV2403162.1 xanthine dehydrogenase small subunit [Marinomonas sargassi]
MKFLLNDELVTDNTLPSDFSALRYLREKQGLTGTKEGCGSGDCGACTLLVGALEEGEVAYSTFNSCITPVQALAGKHVVSVEYLSESLDKLHPAQQAMVDHHGSQCGFCTPGIVLSLASLYENSQSANKTINRSDVCDAISGNLCRCTGYRPIIDAGLAMQSEQSTAEQSISEHSREEAWSNISANSEQVKAQLESLQQEAQSANNYFQPDTLAELLAIKADHKDAVLIAGGTDLMLENTQRFHDFDVLIDVSCVKELTQIEESSTSISLGASVTYSELEAFSKTRYPHLFHLLERIASRQIRNRGTIGGNVANGSPIADMPPILLALDADIHLVKVDGSKRVVNINDFYLGYKQTELAADELIQFFEIDLAKLDLFHRFYKVSKRMEDDISSVMLAVRFAVEDQKITDVRFAFGGMAATPIRASQTENALLGASINDEQALLQAMNTLKEELSPLSDMRASAGYRSDIAASLIRKALLELNGHQVPTFSGHPVSNADLGYEVAASTTSASTQGGASHA